jgi:hypothetical protein
MQEIGESRLAMGEDVCLKAKEIADNMKAESSPFYIIYACKPDRVTPNVFRQTFQCYRYVPKGIIGLLVWYVDNEKGIFEFKKELSSPMDIPTDPSLLSTKSQDLYPDIAVQGERLKVIY